MRDLSKTKRIVIKVGTNVLSRNRCVDTDFLRTLATQISALVQQKRQVILVTSGAIGMGAGALRITHKIGDVKKRQACAAIGQGILMHEYRQAFGACGQEVAQVLLTNKIMSSRKYYVNLKNTVETLLKMGVVPIVNENDCVSIDEIGLAFGDNDLLSALVASKIDAELLIMLTDVEGLYDENPRRSRRARLVPVVYEITDAIKAMACKSGSTFSTGGMSSKIEAIGIASNAGCKAVLAHGREPEVIGRIVAGEEIGTLFLAKRRLGNRKRWILNCSSEAYIDPDPGAATAIAKSRSLLLVGITGIRGSFQKGDVVHIGDFAKGITEVASDRLSDLLKQKNQRQATEAPQSQIIVHANNMVVLPH